MATEPLAMLEESQGKAMPGRTDGESRLRSLGSDGNAALAASLAAFGAYIYLGLKTPLPGLDQDVSSGLEVERREFVTADGLTLRLKRYANPGGIPVLLSHGFGGNGFTFDLPREDRSMAVHLAREGFDVWISSFRGCGREPYLSDEGDWRHSMDHLAIYDAPALVDGIAGATGKRVFWIGHSMGGMVLYMYLQGARFEDGDLVVSDPGLVADRHGKLLGGATMGAPSVFCWPYDDPDRKGFNGSQAGRKRLKSHIEMMLAKEAVSPRVYATGNRSRIVRRHRRLVMAITRSPFVAGAYNRSNTDKETTTSLALWGKDDVSAGMWVQRLLSLLEGDLRQHPPSSPGATPYDYAANMSLITLPLLFLTGDRDYSPNAVNRYGYQAVSSDKKKLVRLPEYGHTDLLMGSRAHLDVYPLLADWIKEVAAFQ
jgi:pimeloyl-ACP methyl ester carboxylesterase